MSVHLSDLVWRCSAHKGSELLVLLAIADNGDWDTGQAYPSIEHIAQKTRLSKSGVSAILKKLVGGDEITIIKKGARGRATLYRISVETLQTKPDRLVRSSNLTAEYVHSEDKIGSLASGHQPSVEPSGFSSSETSSPQKSVEVEIQDIHDCWRSERSKTNGRYATITPGRKQKIASRLKEFTADELKQAIRNVAKDPWEGRKLNDDLIIIFRSQEQVDKFLAFGDNGASADAAWEARRFKPGEQA